MTCFNMKPIFGVVLGGNMREFLGNRIKFIKENEQRGFKFLYTPPDSPPPHRST